MAAGIGIGISFGIGIHQYFFGIGIGISLAQNTESFKKNLQNCEKNEFAEI